jgi:hypothetical protein
MISVWEKANLEVGEQCFDNLTILVGAISLVGIPASGYLRLGAGFGQIAGKTTPSS